MKQLIVKIIENKKVAEQFYKMRVASSYLAKASKPGQFVEVRCSEKLDPLLRRPLGVHRILRSGIELLYEVVGRGTEVLSRKDKGGYLDVIGPLGNGFDLNAIRYTLNAILIAGGIGVAPLVALAEELAYSVERIAYRKKIKTYVLMGAKSKSHILCESDFKKIGCEVLISTEDGSKGKRGLITDVLKDLLSAKRYPLPSQRSADPPLAENATIYACGPVGMLKTVAKLAAKRRIQCQVSLEERMACGVGVCLGCPVKVRTTETNDERRTTHDEYKMVCKDGPVFDAREIAW